jgi:methanogenic corrinoid protein MtbC1
MHSSAEAPAGPPAMPSRAAIDLALFAMANDPEATRTYVARVAAGQAFESVCLALVAPAARHLGALWDDDRCSFADVTIGLIGLQRALQAVTTASKTMAPSAGRRCILLAPAPGNQHGPGLDMLKAFFDRAGWHVTTGQGVQPDELVAQVRQGWFGVVGLSVGSAAQLESLPAFLARLRQVSSNRSVGIMLGGPVFLSDPGLARRMGADATAADGLQATWQAENLLGLQPGAD